MVGDFTWAEAVLGRSWEKKAHGAWLLTLMLIFAVFHSTIRCPWNTVCSKFKPRFTLFIYFFSLCWDNTLWLSHFFLSSACKPQQNPHTGIEVVSISTVSFFSCKERAEVTQQPEGKKIQGDTETNHSNTTVTLMNCIKDRTWYYFTGVV